MVLSFKFVSFLQNGYKQGRSTYAVSTQLPLVTLGAGTWPRSLGRILGYLLPMFSADLLLSSASQKNLLSLPNTKHIIKNGRV